MKKLVAKVIDSFRGKWSEDPDTLSIAPGRVNLIGEHTDYTGGFVLPVAIDRYIVIAAKKTGDSKITGYSIDFDDEASCQTNNYDSKHPKTWFRYIIGVLSELELAGHAVPGFNFSIGGNIPIDSGLSSSAALEMAVLTAMEGLLGFKMKDTEAALLCQRAENDFVGMSCGIMDQFISRIGQREHALFIDCADLSSRAIRINLPGHSWVVIDSGKRRGLVDSEYNKRRHECEEALEKARAQFPDRDIANLRDVSAKDLPLLKQTCSDIVYRRLKHVVTENDRVLMAVSALERGDADTIGKLLYASHKSLRDDFEVSCDELDSLVKISSAIDGVCGARLTGAGFGGSIIILAHNDSVPTLTKAIEEDYHPAGTEGEFKAQILPIQISNGAHLLQVGKL
jgi:galactokinase